MARSLPPTGRHLNGNHIGVMDLVMELCMRGTSAREMSADVTIQLACKDDSVGFSQVASWSSHIGVVSCLKWAPRRAMFAAAATSLVFWIPNQDTSNESTLKADGDG
ncbi:hypothetical protein Taro_053223 [Colocasia esculenta]|uniref:Uncharacterized protein n=1 Tax=Colocasia esculenta TaxID=4460 RepID=A0A843XMI4_COLES|nr:hypothetical protein [Colocasia esculenta]